MLKCVKKIFKYEIGMPLFFSSLVIKLSTTDTVWFSVPDFVKNAEINCFEDNYNELTKRTKKAYPFIDEGGEKFTNLSCIKAMMYYSNLDYDERYCLLSYMEDIEFDINSEKKYKRINKKLKIENFVLRDFLYENFNIVVEDENGVKELKELQKHDIKERVKQCVMPLKKKDKV